MTGKNKKYTDGALATVEMAFHFSDRWASGEQSTLASDYLSETLRGLIREAGNSYLRCGRSCPHCLEYVFVEFSRQQAKRVKESGSIHCPYCGGDIPAGELDVPKESAIPGRNTPAPVAKMDGLIDWRFVRIQKQFIYPETVRLPVQYSEGDAWEVKRSKEESKPDWYLVYDPDTNETYGTYERYHEAMEKVDGHDDIGLKITPVNK